MVIPDPPVLVTGATGFVGAAVVAELLAGGYRVRGTTRDVAAARRAGVLDALPGAAERLELVEADFDRGGFGPAAQGCAHVIHVASPYTIDVADPQRELVAPAVNGTRTVLSAAAEAGTVGKVVLTSSFAAVGASGRDEPFTEDDWNTQASVDHAPYHYSKVAAERAAWTFLEQQDPGFDLVVLNPVVVFGPTLIVRVNQSHDWFVGLTNGEFSAVIPLDFPMVDVRDVALAHVRAIERPAHGRHLLSAGNFSPRRILEIAQELGLTERYRFPRLRLGGPVGVALTKLIARTRPAGTKAFLLDSVGRRFEVDARKSRRELGIDYRDLDQTIADTWTDLDRHGLLGR